MLNKIKKYLYGFFFGLKNADSEMFTSKNSSTSDSGYIQQIKETNIGKDLLKGEVTQEVEDLRYSTYAVYKESNQYEYIGNGVAVYKPKEEINLNNYKFTQRNKKFCKSVLESIDENKDDMDSFTLTFSYDDISRFKLERYVEYITVHIVNGSALISLKFNKDYDLSTPMTKMFYNELMKLLNNDVKYNDFTILNSICFTTFKAVGEDDFIMYVFSNLEYKRCEETDESVIVYFGTNVYSREDLTSKFFSKNQKDKYDMKLGKEKTRSSVSSVVSHKCSECGETMNEFDYDITQHDFGRSLCVKCLEKYLTFD